MTKIYLDFANPYIKQISLKTWLEIFANIEWIDLKIYEHPNDGFLLSFLKVIKPYGHLFTRNNLVIIIHLAGMQRSLHNLVISDAMDREYRDNNFAIFVKSSVKIIIMLKDACGEYGNKFEKLKQRLRSRQREKLMAITRVIGASKAMIESFKASSFMKMVMRE